MDSAYNRTLYACFTGYVTQAIIVNLAPLLFLTFQASYGIPLAQITLLITINFIVQLSVDLAAVFFVDRIGYRAAAVLAHVCAASGLILMTILPEVLESGFLGLLISVVFYAIGGGLLEVLVSPIVEACPTPNKEKAMSLLHSFYCWGCVAVIVLSTLLFSLFGIRNWRIVVLLWALVPVVNGIAFTRVPLAPPASTAAAGWTLRGLFARPVFWVFMLLMLCSGACELAVGQWASTFAEKGLGVSKVVGDLAGPAMFAACAGVARLAYGHWGEKMNLRTFMVGSAVVCCVSFLVIGLSPLPWLGLFGCGLAGLSIGIMWPGSLSTISASLPGGGTALFALMALAGDLGCSAGPTLVGLVSSASGDNLQRGILAATVFPIVLVLCLVVSRRLLRRQNMVVPALESVSS
ncbi:MAG: MFS transporter [Anaerolineae bacterium]